MLFKSLALKNFKCFEEVEVEFAPITLLTGANSSGKSSLIYSLLAMLQTEQFPLYLSPNGKYVDMGSFEEMVFQGDLTKNIELNISALDSEFSKKKRNTISINTNWISTQNNNFPKLYTFEENSGPYKYKMTTNDQLYYFDYYLHTPSSAGIRDFVYHMMVSNLSKNEKFKSGKNLSTNYSEVHFTDTPFLNIEEFTKIASEISDAGFGHFSPVTMLSGIVNPKNDLDDDFNYIGSFRLPPQRTYYQKAKAQEKVGVNGEGYIDQIIEWEETNPEKFKELNEIMADLELIHSIQSEKMKGGRFELTVKTKENSSIAALTDVGFGISQFLPVIVADLQLPGNSCLALSQPEIHLHPKIQALFGNYLAKQINKSSKQYIVETHSEYLLNRIRLLLVKGELKPEDVRVYYFENDGVKSKIHNVEFTTDGQIVGAPDGFFDTYGMDVMDIALNA